VGIGRLTGHSSGSVAGILSAMTLVVAKRFLGDIRFGSDSMVSDIRVVRKPGLLAGALKLAAGSFESAPNADLRSPAHATHSDRLMTWSVTTMT
jgi:hypothetical protein